MEQITQILGTFFLCVLLWAVVFGSVYFVMEKFFHRVDGWIIGALIAFVSATAFLVALFEYNHVSFTL